MIPGAVCPRRAVASKLDLLGEREGILDLDAEILDGTPYLGMAEEKLDGAQIAGALVDLGCLGAPERMRAISGRIEPDQCDPVFDEALVLPDGQMRAGADAAREEPVAIGYALLANPLYAGRVRHKGKVHPGQHKGVADEALWQAVQERLAANRQRTARRADARDPSPLAGKLIDPDGRRMRPSHATKNGRRYRYYISADLVEGSVETGATGWRITISDIARRDGIHAADVSRSMQLAFLAPDIVEAVIDGSQPEGLTSESLKRFGELPLAWDEQRAMLR